MRVRKNLVVEMRVMQTKEVIATKLAVPTLPAAQTTPMNGQMVVKLVVVDLGCNAKMIFRVQVSPLDINNNNSNS